MDITTIIYRTLAGSANDKEKKKIEEWMSHSADNRIEFEDIQLLFENENAARNTSTSDETFYKGFKKIQGRIKGKLRKRKLNNTFKLAALIIAAVLVGTHFLLPKSNEDENSYLRYENISLTTVIRNLEKEYDISIHVEKNEALACHFTGLFHRNYSADEIVTSLASALDLKLEILNTRNYKLSGSGCDKKPIIKKV